MVDTLIGRVRDTAWDLWDSFRDAPLISRLAVSAVLLAAVLGGAVALAAAATGGEDRASSITYTRLEAIAEGLQDDPEAAISGLPPWAVGRFDGVDDTGRFTGTVAIEDDRSQCVGLLVSVGPGWLLEGDPSAITVEGPQALPADRCVPSG